MFIDTYCVTAPMLGLRHHSSHLLPLVFSPARKYEDSTPFLLSTSSPIPLSQAALTMSVTVRSGKDKACIPICIPRPSLAHIRAM